MSKNADDRADDYRAIADLAEAFTELVEHLTQNHTVELNAGTILDFAQRCMPGAQHTGLVLVEDGAVRTVAASSDLPAKLDAIRGDVGEGPTLDALEINDMVVSGELNSDPRWPQFGPRAVDELGIRSLASYRLHLGPRHRAALTFLSDWPYAFDELSVAIGAIFAAYCSLALLAQPVLGDRLTPRQAAIVHREIGVAVGILLCEQGLSVDRAYGRLHEASRKLNRNLADVAHHVVAHRRLPTEPVADQDAGEHAH